MIDSSKKSKSSSGTEYKEYNYGDDYINCIEVAYVDYYTQFVLNYNDCLDNIGYDYVADYVNTMEFSFFNDYNYVNYV